MADAKTRELTTAEIDASVAKANAEAVAALAEAEKHNSESKKYIADARKLSAEAMRAECFAKTEAIDLERNQELRRRELSQDTFHHVYQFMGKVSESSVATAVRELSYWNRDCPGCDIEIVLNSPGGEVIAGMAMFDYLQFLRSKGHDITTVCIGYAASMAGILLQAGDTRVMGRESYVLIHEVSFGAGGKIGEVEDEVAFVRKIQERVLNIFSKRSLEAQPKTGLTVKQFANRWRRKDWWVDSDEAMKLGIVDMVR